MISETSLTTFRLAEAEANAMVMEPHACKVMDEPPVMITHDTFLTTSPDGVRYIPAEDPNGEVSEEYGTYSEAITATLVLEEAITDNTATLTLFSCPYLIDESVTNAFPNLQNLDIFLCALKANLEDVSEFTIYAKSLETTLVTVENPQPIMITFIAVLPVAIFLFGLVLWIKRRKL